MVLLSRDATRSVEGRVHVEGVDGRAGARGVLFERHRPVAIVVREDGNERELAIEPPQRGPQPWALMAAPAVALMVRAIVRARVARAKGR